MRGCSVFVAAFSVGPRTVVTLRIHTRKSFGGIRGGSVGALRGDTMTTVSDGWPCRQKSIVWEAERQDGDQQKDNGGKKPQDKTRMIQQPAHRFRERKSFIRPSRHSDPGFRAGAGGSLPFAACFAAEREGNGLP